MSFKFNLSTLVERHINGIVSLDELSQIEPYTLPDTLPEDTQSNTPNADTIPHVNNPTASIANANSTSNAKKDTVFALHLKNEQSAVTLEPEKQPAKTHALGTIAQSVSILSMTVLTIVITITHLPDFLDDYMELKNRQQAYDQVLKKSFIAMAAEKGVNLFEDPATLLNLTPTVNTFETSENQEILTNLFHTKSVLSALQHQLQQADVQQTLEQLIVASSQSLEWPLKNSLLEEQDIEYPENFPGIHIATKQGTPVLAIERGKVLHVETTKNGYGILILIQHPNDIIAVYAKSQNSLVSAGDTVNRGQQLAETGTTTLHNKPGLYFEIRNNGTAENPFHYLASL